MFRSNTVSNANTCSDLVRGRSSRSASSRREKTGADAISTGDGKGNTGALELGSYALMPEGKSSPRGRLDLLSREKLSPSREERHRGRFQEAESPPPYSMDANLLHIRTKAAESKIRLRARGACGASRCARESPAKPKYIDLSYHAATSSRSTVKDDTRRVLRSESPRRPPRIGRLDS